MSSARDLLSSFTRWFSSELTRAARAPATRLGIFACLALWATWPYLATASMVNDFRDAQVLDHYESVAALIVRRFGQAPLWDPYYCGGLYLLGTPQARFVSPTFLLTLLFGETRGAALTLFVMLVVGLEGAFRYARSRGALEGAAFVAAPVFGLSGVFAMAPSLGWTNFYGFALLPWIALGVRRALRFDPRGAALAALCVAWCIGFGGTYAVPLSAVWCALEALEALTFAAIGRNLRRVLGVLAMGAVVVALAAGAGAIRLWPVAETMAAAPRVVGSISGFEALPLFKMLFAVMKAKTEDGTYFIGFLALPAVVAGLYRWRSAFLGLYVAIALWLSPGYGIAGSLFPALSRLPVFGTLRYPERYLILVGFAASALAARGLTTFAAVERHGRRPVLLSVARLLLTLSLIVGMGPMLWDFHHAAATRELSPPPVTLDRPFHQARGTRWELSAYAPMERGSLSCWDAYPVPESPLLQGDLEHEEYLADPTAGTLEERRWSPDAIDLDVDLARPTRVLVNQNWHRGWRVNDGAIANERGLLAVDLPAGKHALALRFAPRSARGGLFVTLVSLAVIGALARRRRPRLRFTALAALAPLVAFGASFVLFDEARAETLPPLAPTGEAVVIDTLPPDATRLDTRLAGGITLVGVRIDHPTPTVGDTIHVELFWRRDAKIAPGQGIFVHLEPDHGKRVDGDHVQLSQVLSFDAAPAGPILRDILPITIVEDALDKVWTVKVGLWRIQRGGDRVPVIDNGAATVSDDRIVVGRYEVRIPTNAE